MADAYQILDNKKTYTQGNYILEENWIHTYNCNVGVNLTPDLSVSVIKNKSWDQIMYCGTNNPTNRIITDANHVEYLTGYSIKQNDFSFLAKLTQKFLESFSSIDEINKFNPSHNNTSVYIAFKQQNTTSTKSSTKTKSLIEVNFMKITNFPKFFDSILKGNFPSKFSGLINGYGLIVSGALKKEGYSLISPSSGNLVIRGIKEIQNYLSGLTGQDTVIKYQLILSKKNGPKYYDHIITGTSLQILQHINDKDLVSMTSNSPNNNYSYSGLNEQVTTSVTNPGLNGLNITDNSVGQIAYISDFSRFNLVFKFGKDNRTGINDPYSSPQNKAFIDTDDLIIRNNIPKIALQEVSSQITLSDKYYSYSKMTDLVLEKQDFFNRLDDILNLAIEDKKDGNIWINNSVPLIQLKHNINKSSDIEVNWYNNPIKWKLIPMSALAVKRSWYNTLNNYLSDEITIDIAQKSLTLKDCVLDNEAEAISLKTFYIDYTPKERSEYKLLFFDVFLNNANIYDSRISLIRDFNEFLSKINPIINYAEKIKFNTSFVFEQKQKLLNLYELKMFEAYTRGRDFIQEDYTTVRSAEQDKDGNKYMDFDDNYFSYKYTGRKFDLMNLKNDEDKTKLFELPQSKGVYCALVHEKDLLTESDVTLGETYGEKKYFTEVIKYYNSDTNKYEYKDTFKVKNYLDIVDSTKYTEDDIECITSKIDLTQCKYYDATKATYANKWCDCSYGGSFNKECIYQKLGYCPYRFDTEKHPRRIRTLSGEKSNRFNLIQELSSVFKIYPQFYIEFDKNGRVVLDENGYMKKHIFFITEKGNLKNLGFRYEKNLNSITRSIDSTAITTKMFVEDIDSEYSDTGLCSIQTAEDNIGKTNYLLDFSYYTKKGIIDPLQITRDIYGINKGDMAFLPTIGYYNTKYDEYTNLIINMTGETMTEMKAKNDVSVESITACLVERQKLAQKMYQFKVKKITEGKNVDYTTSDTYKNYLEKYKEQSAIMWGNIEDLFFSNDYFNLIEIKTEEDKETYHFTPILFNLSGGDAEKISEEERIIQTYNTKYCKGEFFWRLMIEGFEEESEYIPPFDNWEIFKEKIVEPLLYPTNGNLGQYKSLNDQVKYWKLERAKWLNKINDIADKFYKKYEPYIKEGTWTDDNYLTDNEYFWAANNVLSDSCKPKVSYTVNVSDISTLDDDYLFDLSDTSFVEDVDMFGINQRTGLPNQQKVIISGITEDLDNPTNNSIEIKNFTTSFDELFESISASVQSLTFNENTYKRAANFTATKYISKDSLQGTLFDGDLTLMDTNNENIVIKDDGISGKEIVNTSNQYKLTGEGLFFSKDGGQTWDMGVGPGGINADYIKFGQLDASKIQIIDGNYIYFLWDKSGITAYRNPAISSNGLVDFTRFNKYGLSLIENNNVRLRAGYEFKTDENSNTTGEYQKELELKNQNIGFYLYNDNGQSIFRTETASLYGDNKNYSARMSLNGEMFITNKVLDGDPTGGIISKEYEYVYSNGKKIDDVEVATFYTNEVMVKLYNSDRYIAVSTDSNGQLILDTELNQDDVITQNNKKYITIYRKVSINESHNIKYYQNSTKTRLFKIKNEKIEATNMTYESLTLSSDNSNDIINIAQSLIDTSDSAQDINDILQSIDTNKITLSTMRYSANIFIRTPELGYELIDYESDNILNKNSQNNNIKLLENSNINTTQIEQEITQSAIIKYDDTKTEILSGSISTIHSLIKEYPEDNIKTYQKYEKENIELWNLSELDKDIPYISSPQNFFLYKTVESSINGCTIWEIQELTGESRNTSSTNIITNEVGIFINNKTSIDGGSTVVQEYGSTVKIGNVNNISNSTTIDNNDLEATNIDNDNFYIIGDTITAGLSESTALSTRAVGVNGCSMDVFGKSKNLESIEKITQSNIVFFDEQGVLKIKYLCLFFGLHDINDNYTSNDYSLFIKQLLNNFNNLKYLDNNPIIYAISPIYSTIYTEENYNKFIKMYKEAIDIINNEGIYTINFIDIYNKTKEITLSDNGYPSWSGYGMLYNILKDTFSNNKEYINTEIFKEERMNTEDIDQARDTILSGAERVYMIALTGENSENQIVYNNVLTVLKNGCMYIGGTINDFYGRPLNLEHFGQMPDEVRINDAKIIMANNGMVWMNFKKVFMIDDSTGHLSKTSLWQAINEAVGVTGDTSEEDSLGIPSGYYLIDPIKD